MRKRFISFVLACCAPAFILAGCADDPGASDPSVETPIENATEEVVMQDTQPEDTRGVSGMLAYPIRGVLETAPFGVPMTEEVPASAEASEFYSSSCTSSGSEGNGVLYDYSITMDEDGEIIGASFGVTSTTANEQQLLLAADLLFYAVSIVPYDTSDESALSDWFEEMLPVATSDGAETVVGDAKYQLYGTPGLMYWVDISNNSVA